MATASPWQRPFPPAQIDFAVVGGGIIGAATAYALSRLEPEATVLILEAERLASGASGRNAGFLMPGAGKDPATSVDSYGEEVTRLIWRFNMENVDMVQRIAGDAAGVRLTGFELVAGSEEEAERLNRSGDIVRSFGTPCKVMEARKANDRLGTEGFFGGLFVAAGGVVDPVALVRRLAQLSQATVIEQSPVTGISASGDEVVLSGQDFEVICGKAILCLNAYLPRLLPGTESLVRPVRAQMLATAPVDRFLEPPVYTHDGFFYVRQRVDGRMLIGGARHFYIDEERGYEDLTTHALQRDLESFLHTHFPRAGRPPIQRRWSGTMGFSPDGLPIVGRMSGNDRVLYACGFTGHGLAYGARFGQLLANQALGRRDAAATLFSNTRASLGDTSESQPTTTP